MVLVEVLDRVFDGDDVAGAGLVDRADERRHARGLAGTGRPAEQDQPLLARDQVAHRIRQPDLVERRDVGLHQTQRDRGLAALEEHVPAEAIRPVRKGKVGVAVSLEAREIMVEQIAEVFAHEFVVDHAVAVDGRDGSVDAHHRRLPDREYEVGSFRLDDRMQCRLQRLVNIHRAERTGANTRYPRAIRVTPFAVRAPSTRTERRRSSMQSALRYRPHRAPTSSRRGV